jgi:hypothetical protein
MRVIRDKDNRVEFLVLFESELCDQLEVTAEQLREWGDLFVPAGQDMHPDRETLEPIFRLTREQLDRFAQYAKILKTGMTLRQVKELELKDIAARKSGKRSNFLEMYSILAEECPAGITAHALRSYCVLFLYQNRGGKMLLSKDLAKAANISEDTALRHIRYLQATQLLQLAQNPPRWNFSFVPKAMSRYYAS